MYPLGAIGSSLYVSIGHTAWGVALAWVVIACCSGHGGIEWELSMLTAPTFVLRRETWHRFFYRFHRCFSIVQTSPPSEQIDVLRLFSPPYHYDDDQFSNECPNTFTRFDCGTYYFLFENNAPTLRIFGALTFFLRISGDPILWEYISVVRFIFLHIVTIRGSCCAATETHVLSAIETKIEHKSNEPVKYLNSRYDCWDVPMTLLVIYIYYSPLKIFK